jgi:TolA-binding protein
LALEVRSIDAVRERLRAGDARQALDLLVKHRAQFGSGALGPEALFLQMEAERALGRRAAAVRTARQILERFPKGPSAESARQLLGE